MSILERKLSLKKDLSAFHPADEPEPVENIPPRQHNFHNWQQYINGTFGELSLNTYSRCLNQCKYDISMMAGRKSPFNDNADFYCSEDCKVKWLVPFQRCTKIAEIKAQRDYELCMKNDQQFEIETKDLLECKRVMFNSYLDSVLDSEQDYLKAALEKYS